MIQFFAPRPALYSIGRFYR